MLKNKVVFITGASSGIGLACAEAFAKQGAHLVLVARSSDKLAGLSASIEKSFDVKTHSVTLDVSNAKAVDNAIRELPDGFKNIHILVNNAGLAQGIDRVQNGNIDDWDKMIDVNIKGLLYVTRGVIKTMVERGEGHIINIGSISSHQVYPGGSVYCATKFAVKALTQGIKMDVHGTPIRVSQVDPGMVKTNYALTRFKGDEAVADAVYEGMTPLTADNVAESVVFCASQPKHVNISEIVVLPVDQTAAHMVNRSGSEH